MGRRVAAVAVLLVVGGAAWGIADGLPGSRSRLVRTIDALHAEGLAPTPEEWRASLPPVDPSLQARVNAALRRLPDHSVGEAEWFFADQPAPESVRRWREEARDAAEELARLLEGGSVSLAHWAVDSPVPETPRLWTRIGALARWHGLSALDPGTRVEAMATLDRMHAAIRPVASFGDLLAAWTLSEQRDLAFLRGAIAGIADPAALDAWAAEEPDWARLEAQERRSSRVAHALKAARILAAGGTIEDAFPEMSPPDDPVAWWRERVVPWYCLRDDCATDLEFDAAFERYVLGTGDARSVRASFEACGEAGFPYTPWQPLEKQGRTCALVYRQALHRMYRLAARTVAQARTAGGLPTDATAWASALGATASAEPRGRFDVRLRYEQVDDARFRIRLDPTSPRPDFIDDATWTDARRVPPSFRESGHVVQREWCLEVRAFRGPTGT